MTWTYDSSDPGATSRDWIRLRIGDTDTNDQLLADEEIAAWVSSFGSKQLAAAVCCDSIAAKYARRVDSTHGKVKISWSQLADRYMQLAEELREEAATDLSGVGPWAGSISIADKDTQVEDTDRVAPMFGRDQFDTTTIDAGTGTLTGSTA